MQGEGLGHDEHGWSVNVLEGQVTDVLALMMSQIFAKVYAKVVRIADGHAGGDG
jgi:hypothetical protein